MRCAGTRLLTGAALLATAGCAVSRPAWWFTTAEAVAGERVYELSYRFDHSWHENSTCRLDVAVGSEVPGERLGWHLADYTCSSGGTLEAIITALDIFQEIHDESVCVTPTTVSVGQWPILRGPWRVGDRITVYSIFLIGSVLHAEVTAVTQRRIDLTFEFYGGPTWHGAGTLALDQDDRGLVRIDAAWHGTAGQQPFTARFSATRVTRPTAGGRPERR